MMNVRSLLRTFVASAFAAALSAAALGQVNPPPWWGTDDGNTTSQSWKFDDASAPLDPNFVVNPFGTPLAGALGDVIHETTALDRNGVMVLRSGGQLVFDIPNEFRPEWVKQCWLQFIYAVDGTGTLGIDPGGSNIENVVVTNDPIPGTPWATQTVTFDLRPQPPFELITFTANENSVLFLDEVHFGTHCIVPEPATMAALGLGAVALIRRRRK